MVDKRQPVLGDLFVVPVAEIPAVPDVPIAPSASVVAKHCSSMGAQKIASVRKSLWARMLAFYRLGPSSDVEMAAMLSLPDDQRRGVIHPSTVSARRREMIRQGLVESFPLGTRKNPKTGVSNSLWGLTEKGRQRQ